MINDCKILVPTQFLLVWICFHNIYTAKFFNYYYVRICESNVNINALVPKKIN